MDSFSDDRDITGIIMIVQQHHAPRLSRSITTDIKRQSVSAHQRKRLSGHSSMLSGYRRDASTHNGRGDLHHNSLAQLWSQIDRQARLARYNTTHHHAELLRSEIDRQTRLARRNFSHDEPPPRSTAYYIRAMGPPADTVSSDSG